MIVKQWLGILQELMEVYSLKLNTVFVPLERNRADSLTRVRKTRLGVPREENETEFCCVGVPSVKQLH